MILTPIDAKTCELVNGSSSDNPATEYSVREWFRMFPESFYLVVGNELAGDVREFVLRLMARNGDCCRHLCNPALMDRPAAIKLSGSLLLVESRLDIRLAQVAVEWAPIEDNQKLLRRCLEILEAIGSCARTRSALLQLLDCQNASVRSKAVNLLVRSTTNEANIRDWLRDRDPRIRANVLESLAEVGREMSWSRNILLAHLNDPHGRVAANSAVGLYRLGMEEAALARLSEMASSAEPSVRCSAAWAMGQTPDGTLLEPLRQLRTDPSPQVRWHALKSLSSLTRAGVKTKQDASDELPPNQAEEPLASPEAQLPEANTDPPEDDEPIVRAFYTRTFGRLI